VRMSQAALDDEPAALMDALDMQVDAISLDLPGDSIAVWAKAGGEAGRERAWEAVQRFLDERVRRTISLPRTWLVPRMQKCDATLEDLESFTDRWLLTAGACVLDASGAGDRIEPLPVPACVRERDAWATVRLRAGHEAIAAGAARVRSLPAAGQDLERAI
jgi:hypothetical protein